MPHSNPFRPIENDSEPHSSRNTAKGKNARRGRKWGKKGGGKADEGKRIGMEGRLWRKRKGK